MQIIRIAIDSIIYPFKNIKTIAAPVFLTVLITHLYSAILMPMIFRWGLNSPLLADIIFNEGITNILFVNAANFILLTLPFLFFITALSVAICRNAASNEAVPLLVLDRALYDRELGTFKAWLKFSILVIFVEVILKILLWVYTGAFQEGVTIFPTIQTQGFLYTLGYELYAELINASSFSSQQPTLGLAIINFITPFAPIALSMVVTYTLWSFFSLAIITGSLDRGNSLKQAFHIAKKNWKKIALTLFTLDVIVSAASLPLSLFVKYLRTLEINRLTSIYPYGLPADAPTLYTDYLSIQNLFLVLVITMYMVALTNLYSRIAHKGNSEGYDR